MSGPFTSGCIWIEVQGSHKISCGRIPAPASSYCPKHVLMAAEKAEEVVVKSGQAKERAEARKRQEEELQRSPLAAVNPEYGTRRKRVLQSGYTDGE